MTQTPKPGAVVLVMSDPRVVDFYFFIGSTYSYLSVCRADAVAASRGITLNWVPFSVRTLMREQNNSPFSGKPVKAAYMWRDIGRRAARYGLPFAHPPRYPIDPEERANRVATLAAMQGWCPDFTRAAYQAWFLKDQDPGAPEVLAGILRGLGRDPQATVAQADSDVVRERYAIHTQQARAAGIFGSPTFCVSGEIFWGDDRLEDALDWSASLSA